MSNASETVLRTLRAQAWIRAKGELEATLTTFHGPDTARPGQFDKLERAIQVFIYEVEHNGLHE